MALQLKQESYGWVSTDGSNLILRGNVEPTEVIADLIGHSGLVNGPTRRLQLAQFAHLRSLPGGSRPTGRPGVNWTNAHQTFAVYSYDNGDWSKPEIVFSQYHGGGAFFAIVDQLDFHKTFSPLVETLPDHAIYDLIQAMIGSYNKGKNDGANVTEKRLCEAFVEGRLKKRKQPGLNVYKVHVEPRQRPSAVMTD